MYKELKTLNLKKNKYLISKWANELKRHFSKEEIKIKDMNVFDIFSPQGNASQYDIEIPSHLSQNGYYQENKQQMLRGCEGEKSPLYTVGENVN
jgi:hypothetical protein